MEYTISLLPHFLNTRYFSPEALNDNGTVAGHIGLPACRVHNNQPQALTTDPDIAWSVAYGINNREQIVGQYRNIIGNTTKAFYWENGVFTDLHDLIGGYHSHALDINDAGQILATRFYQGAYDARGIIYDPGTGVLTEIPIDANVVLCEAINNHGHVVGRYSNPSDGFVYDGTRKVLPTLGGGWVSPFDINDQGLVVGYSGTSEDETHAFVYDSNGIHDIHPPDALLSRANAINNHNVVVGQVNMIGAPETSAFVKEPGKPMELLISKITNINGWSHLLRAVDINDEGQICGYGLINDKYKGFLLSPVKKSPFEIEKLDLPKLVAEILFGVGTGGGGVIEVGGKVIPIDPPVPFTKVLSQTSGELGRLFGESLRATNGKFGQFEHLVKQVYDQGVENHRSFYAGELKTSPD